VNLAAAKMFRQIHWQLHRAALNRVRSQVLNLKPLPWHGPFRRYRIAKQPMLFGFSSHVLPKPEDWPEWFCITGYWYLDRPEWAPPPGLEQFLDSGPPPVYIGFGSVHRRPANWEGGAMPDPIFEMIAAALETVGQRAVVLSGDSGRDLRRWPRTMFPITNAPFEWLFPRVAAVIHHGGSGTTGATVRAGKPSLVIPFLDTQAFWGRRVFELGIAAEPVRPARLSAGHLGAALQSLTRDRAMIERAAAIGARVRAEDGLGRAVEWIQRVIGPPVQGTWS
jgi:UDP:flavonoid glycosyltransferase YjiC (YdhE family)